jgi:hypothetical protein
MNVAAEVAAPLLDSWSVDDPGSGAAFPDGWAFDPEAFNSGLDFASPDLSADDWTMLRAWYEENIGEVPAHVEFLAAHRPRLLKAYRNRMEHLVRGGLPKQMVPYALLYFDVIRGFAPGVRENILLARHFSIDDELIVSGICRAVTSYAGMAGIATVIQAAGDLL